MLQRRNGNDRVKSVLRKIVHYVLIDYTWSSFVLVKDHPRNVRSIAPKNIAKFQNPSIGVFKKPKCYWQLDSSFVPPRQVV